MANTPFKPVISINPETGEEIRYPSMKAAAEKIGVNQARITTACTTGCKCKGFYWRKEVQDEGALTRAQAQIVLGFADSSMSMVDAAKPLYLSAAAVKYNINRIYEKTGKDPRNFYDLCDLVQIAREVLKDEN